MKRYIGLVMSVAVLGAAIPATQVAAAAPVNNASHLYSLDGWGGIHSVGGSPAMTASAYWPNWDIARGIAVFNDGTGGYTLDGWGGVHRFGSAPAISDGAHAYWPNWDIARAIVMAPWATAAKPAGWTMDAWGGIHAFGGAPAVADSSHAYWPGWDIARGFVVFPDSPAGKVSGYILDGWGGLHPFAGGGAAMPSPVQATAYWPGWDIARSVALVPNTHIGYVLDGWGGLHAFAPSGIVLPKAIADASHAYWGGWDIARSVTTWTAGAGGWVMDGWGGFHAFGGAPTPGGSAYWAGWDIAKSSAGAGSGSSARPAPPPPTSRTLGVPMIRQVYNLSCESAALQMALAYRGINASQTDILNVIGADRRRPVTDASGFHWGNPYTSFVGDVNGSEANYTGYGVYAPPIARAATAFGGSVLFQGEGFAPAEVYKAILAGHPVVTWINYDYAYHAPRFYHAFDGQVVQFGAPWEHAVTAVGVNAGSILINDPLSSPRWISKATFESTYGSFNHMAVVIA
ncbi:MAG: hypothetical protein QOE92_1946 [Chloroflexota bacterium]|jgi:uncharacterized protein YvpB|nr:hypothetical protein [Chloroflexota bacterium]